MQIRLSVNVKETQGLTLARNMAHIEKQIVYFLTHLSRRYGKITLILPM